MVGRVSGCTRCLIHTLNLSFAKHTRCFCSRLSVTGHWYAITHWKYSSQAGVTCSDSSLKALNISCWAHNWHWKRLNLGKQKNLEEDLKQPIEIWELKAKLLPTSAQSYILSMRKQSQVQFVFWMIRQVCFKHPFKTKCISLENN